MSEFQPLPGMQESWDKRGQSALDQYGKDSDAIARLAAGFGGADLQVLARNMTGMSKTLLPGDVHMGNLDKQYADINNPDWAPQDFQVGNLDKIEDRMQLLDKLTQNTQGGGIDANGRCGATALMAAAIHAGGNDGIKTILDALKSGADPKDQFAKMKFKALEAKMKAGKLDQDDLSNMNDELNYQLRLKQNEMFAEHKDQIPASGVDPTVLEAFIKGNKNMSEYFKSGKYSIDSVDTDGNGGSAEAMNHFVLSIGGEKNNFIYDPQARKDGHQVVVNPVEVQNYHQKEWRPDRVDASKVGGTPFDGMY